jgi:alpha-methylacyl-CoA racemase
LVTRTTAAYDAPDPMEGAGIPTTAHRGPLAGIRVIELAGMGVVPYAAMVLGDLGADVIRVDRVSGDPLAVPENTFDGRPMDFLVRRSRRSIALDLKTAPGRDVLLDLVEGADALLEGFRPGVMERLSLGPDECLACNPRLAYVRVTGWGQDGPYAHAPGHDINYIGLSGALLAIGRRDGKPSPPLNFLGDFAGGSLFAVIGLLGAVLHARSTGTGQVVDASMVDGVAHLTALYHGMLALGAWREEREANLLDGGSPVYDVYETADGGYMSVAAGEPQFLDALLDQLDLADELAGIDMRARASWPTVRAALTTAFLARTRDEWTEVFAGNPVQCCAPVLSFTEAPSNVHHRARGTYVERDGVTQPAPAPRFGAAPVELHRPPPAAGEHTCEILRELGLGAGDIDALVAEGAVRQADVS